MGVSTHHPPKDTSKCRFVGAHLLPIDSSDLLGRREGEGSTGRLGARRLASGLGAGGLARG